MNEWVVSALVTIGAIVLIVAILYLKEKRSDILVGIIAGIITIAVLIGLINMVHELIYETTFLFLNGTAR